MTTREITDTLLANVGHYPTFSTEFNPWTTTLSSVNDLNDPYLTLPFRWKGLYDLFWKSSTDRSTCEANPSQVTEDEEKAKDWLDRMVRKTIQELNRVGISPDDLGETGTERIKAFSSFALFTAISSRRNDLLDPSSISTTNEDDAKFVELIQSLVGPLDSETIQILPTSLSDQESASIDSIHHERLRCLDNLYRHPYIETRLHTVHHIMSNHAMKRIRSPAQQYLSVFQSEKDRRVFRVPARHNLSAILHCGTVLLDNITPLPDIDATSTGEQGLPQLDSRSNTLNQTTTQPSSRSQPSPITSEKPPPFLRGEPRGKIGKRNYLEEDESRVLERELIELISNGLTPTFKDVAAMARAIKDRRTVFIETSHIDPSRTWVSRWVLAHPKFRAFKPILMELRRQNCLTKSHVAPFFANLQKLVDENHYSPSLMFNFDETSLISTQYVYEKKVGFSSDLVAYTVPPSLTKQSTELIPWLKVVQSAALNALVNAQAVQESFRTTGIYPMNPATVTNKLREGNDTEERETRKRLQFPFGQVDQIDIRFSHATITQGQLRKHVTNATPAPLSRWHPRRVIVDPLLFSRHIPHADSLSWFTTFIHRLFDNAFIPVTTSLSTEVPDLRNDETFLLSQIRKIEGILSSVNLDKQDKIRAIVSQLSSIQTSEQASTIFSLLPTIRSSLRRDPLTQEQSSQNPKPLSSGQVKNLLAAVESIEAIQSRPTLVFVKSGSGFFYNKPVPFNK
ncbi:hypothetical protein BLNAU_4312 [Blattamonas nauphoetae]|uniref:HTH CENPB-type domain-containing protein n=1 Tax=Blattamonas nauphoetae TaxID=2049346 RepID=A0ABQ9YA74_9EUKA|nr:hypothetical protein BLNAU_4312 [Blattamonas nauphoetae]